MKAFVQANVYIGGEIRRSDLLFDTRVRGFTHSGDAQRIELPADALVVPGFIDEHVHGAGGADAMDGTTAALRTIANALAAEGTTSFLATTMTQTQEAIAAAMRAVRAYREKNEKDGARLLGVHLEGPFISEKHCGAQPPSYIRMPDIGLFDEWNAQSGKSIRLLTLAPEEQGALPLIEHLKKSGVTVSVGHSDATCADVQRAVGKGASCVTHTFNAQRGIHHREIGVAGSAMLLDELYAEVIADTVHVSVPALRLVYKNKPDKLILITDAMRAKGLADGESELGGQKVTVRGGEARLCDGTLAGSVLKMNDAVKNMVLHAGVPLGRAIDCATMHPAENMGLAADYGSIEIGKAADFAVLSPSFEVLATYRDGECVFRS